jgi:imidazolonepropionase-like amidohydrolase
LQAIQTATINAADLLSQQDKIGETKIGAFADIIAVKGDPTKDIKLLEHVLWVMKDGKVCKNPQ